MKVFISLLLPFLGTTLGAFCVYFIKKNIKKKFEIIILAFAAGVMMAASIWSLIMPSIQLANVFVSSIGLICGVLLFYLLDRYLNKKNSKKDKMQLAINIHNIPEGMAVGVLIASYLQGSATYTMVLALAIGIALQNFPEGLIVSLPSFKKCKNKNKAFLDGVKSACFETLGAIVTLIFTNVITSILPLLLNVAAGAMIYVVITELIPESQTKENTNTIWFTIGFIIMMLLDVLV